jgi:hypothetical protein
LAFLGLTLLAVATTTPFDRILYEMGMEGVRETQFAREIYAITQPHVEASGVDDTDLDMFI